MFRSIFIIAALSLLATGCSGDLPNPKNTNQILCQCIGVHDGDTITVLTRNKKQYRVRLTHIDCPEKGQPFGENAKKFTSDFCFGKWIKVVFNGKKDRNDRILGEVLSTNNESLNQLLVEAGLAWHFKRYSAELIYDQLEKDARLGGKGLWKDVNPIAPWDWRKSH